VRSPAAAALWVGAGADAAAAACIAEGGVSGQASASRDAELSAGEAETDGLSDAGAAELDDASPDDAAWSPAGAAAALDDATALAESVRMGNDGDGSAITGLVSPATVSDGRDIVSPCAATATGPVSTYPPLVTMPIPLKTSSASAAKMTTGRRRMDFTPLCPPLTRAWPIAAARNGAGSAVRARGPALPAATRLVRSPSRPRAGSLLPT